MMNLQYPSPQLVSRIMLRSSMFALSKLAHAPTMVNVRSFSTERPFRILGLQQIAMGGLDKQKMSHFWVDIMGLNKVTSFVSEKENVDEDVLSLGNGPYAVEVDIMQPLDANKSPKVHEPALNHVGFWVDNLPKCVEHLTSQGVRFAPGGIRKGASGHDVCFIHPKVCICDVDRSAIWSAFGCVHFHFLVSQQTLLFSFSLSFPYFFLNSPGKRRFPHWFLRRPC